MLGFALLAGVVAAAAAGPSHGIWVALAALILATMMTVPSDLQDGEYDMFGCGLVAALVVMGLVAASMAGERSPVSYSKDSGVCDSGCDGDR